MYVRADCVGVRARVDRRHLARGAARPSRGFGPASRPHASSGNPSKQWRDHGLVLRSRCSRSVGDSELRRHGAIYRSRDARPVPCRREQARRSARDHQPAGAARLPRARHVGVRDRARGLRGEVDARRPRQPPGRVRARRGRRGVAATACTCRPTPSPGPTSTPSAGASCSLHHKEIPSDGTRHRARRATRSCRCACTSRTGGPRSSSRSARGKRAYDKRQALAERDAKREAERAMKGIRE